MKILQVHRVFRHQDLSTLLDEKFGKLFQGGHSLSLGVVR